MAAAAAMSSAVRPSREALVAALTACEEKMVFYKKEMERLEKEKELLKSELQVNDMEPLHDRLGAINAALHDCLKRKELNPEESEDMDESINLLLLDRKRALLPDAQTGERALVGMNTNVWLSLSHEERQQRGYVLAALRSLSRYHVKEHGFDVTRFDEVYPQLSMDRDAFLKRIERGDIDIRSHLLQDEAFVIPEAFRNDQDIVLVVLRHESFGSLQYVSDELLSSPEFIEKVFGIAKSKYSFEANDLLTCLLDKPSSRRAVSSYPHLAVQLLGHKSRCYENESPELGKTFWDEDYLLRLFEEVFEGHWPREVVVEWVQGYRDAPEDHPSFIVGDDTELALLVPKLIPDKGEFVMSAILRDSNFALEAINRGAMWVYWHLPGPMQFEFDVLLAALNSCNGSLFNIDARTFDDRLYSFGQEVRQVMARCDSSNAFLEGSNNLCGLGLDEDTTSALIKKISAFVGVPTQKELTRLRTALVKTKNMGY